MNNFYKGGRGLCLPSVKTQCIASPRKKKLQRLQPIACGLLLLCFISFSLSDAWAQSAESRTAEGQDTVRPLHLGEKVPEEFWTKKHLFFVDGDTIRKSLEECRGKVLVLDFWFSGCTKCLLHQKDINYYKEKFVDDLAVIMVNSSQFGDNYDKLLKYIKSEKFKHLGLNTLVSIIDDNYLEKLFPHTGCPTYFWINSRDFLQVLTYRNFLDASYTPPFLDK